MIDVRASSSRGMPRTDFDGGSEGRTTTRFGCNRNMAETIAFDSCKTFVVNFTSYVAGGFAGTGVTLCLEPYCGKSWASAIGGLMNYVTRYTLQYAGGMLGDRIQARLGIKSFKIGGALGQACAETSSLLVDTSCGMASAALGIYVGMPIIKGSNEQSAFGSFAAGVCDAVAKTGSGLLSPYWRARLEDAPGNSRMECRKLAVAVTKGLLAGGMAESIRITGMPSTSKTFLSSFAVYLGEGICDFGARALGECQAVDHRSGMPQEEAERESKVHVA